MLEDSGRLSGEASLKCVASEAGFHSGILSGRTPTLIQGDIQIEDVTKDRKGGSAPRSKAFSGSVPPH